MALSGGAAPAQAARRYSWIRPPRRSWSLHRAESGRDLIGRRPWSALIDTLVGPGLMVVPQELAEHPLQVPPTEDEHMIEQLSAGCAHPALAK